MKGPTLNKNTLELQIEIDELSPHQVRLVRSIAMLLGHVLTIDDESEFFESSSELMKTTAALIKQSNFIANLPENNKKAYALQAVEYSVDNLCESVESSRVINFDN